MIEEYPRCKRCGTVVERGYSLCLKCRSDMLLPQCDYFEYKTKGFIAPVPWCNKDNNRVITKDGFKCRWCNEPKSVGKKVE